MLNPILNKHLPFGEKRDSRFYNQHILSVKQFSRDDLENVFQVADEMKAMVQRVGSFDLLKGKVLTNLFYEPSTRTSSSFVAAIERLGGSVIQINNVQFSSVSKGESLPDTIRTLASYSDAIVLRHPEKGAAALAAEYSPKPIINAGDGIGEHPTQALLDLYTILAEQGRLDGLTVTMLGDMKNGRTVHSLSQLLAHFGAKINYVSPDSLRMPADLMQEIAKIGTPQAEYTQLEPVLAESDVLYVTRVQKERFANVADYDAVKDSYVITPQVLSQAKSSLTLMHPLPRVNEISTEVDSDPRAAYFRQMENGMYVRMALLAMVLGKA